MRRIVAGDARVWRAAAVVSAAMLALIAWQLLIPRDFYTGTNSVRGRSVVATVPPGSELCVPELSVPAGTGRVEFDVAAPAATGLVETRVRTAAGVQTGSVRDAATGSHKLAIPIGPAAPGSAAATGTVCVRPLQGPLDFRGVAGLDRDPAPLLGGRRLDGRVAVWFRPPAGKRSSLASRLDDAVDRAALFRPGIVGPWTYVLLLAVAIPALWFSAIRLLAVAPWRRPRRLMLGVTLLALVNGIVWGLITPAFDAPDEPEHFAYAQYLAETGKAPSASPDERLPLSDQQSLALQAVRIYLYQEGPDGKPPWSAAQERQWERLAAALRPPPARDNGGGATSATVHAPAYYGLLAPGYLATRGQSPFSQLEAMRLTSTLLAALVVALVFLTLAELFPRYPVAWVAGALLVAFQPMFGFMAGAVNNDMGVNAAAAGVLLLLIVALRRGLTLPVATGAGALLALAPLFKGTAYTFFVVAALAIALLVTDRERRRLTPLLAFAATFLAVELSWVLLSGFFDRDTFTTPSGDSPVQSVSILQNPTGYLSYLWQVFLPPLPFMTDLHVETFPFFHIYVERVWGAFGWIALLFPRWVYVVALAGMAATGALALVALRREWPAVRSRWREALLLAAVAIGVVMGVEAAFTTLTPRPAIAEQGRYVFTALPAYAALVVLACLAFGRRRFPTALAVAVTLVVGFSATSQLFVFTSAFA